MVFDKVTRQRIYTGEQVEITWPANAAQPRPDATYTVQTGSRGNRGHLKAGPFSIRVRRVRELPEGRYAALVQVEGDPVRLLAKRGGEQGDGYTDHEGRAMVSTGSTPDGEPEPEPEAISEYAFAQSIAPSRDRQRFLERLDDVARMDERSQAQRLREIRKRARDASIDIDDEIRAVEKALEEAKAKLERAA